MWKATKPAQQKFWVSAAPRSITFYLVPSPDPPGSARVSQSVHDQNMDARRELARAPGHQCSSPSQATGIVSPPNLLKCHDFRPGRCSPIRLAPGLEAPVLLLVFMQVSRTLTGAILTSLTGRISSDGAPLSADPLPTLAPANRSGLSRTALAGDSLPFSSGQNGRPIRLANVCDSRNSPTCCNRVLADSRPNEGACQ